MEKKRSIPDEPDNRIVRPRKDSYTPKHEGDSTSFYNDLSLTRTSLRTDHDSNSGSQNNPFPFLKLPWELRRMALSHLIEPADSSFNPLCRDVTCPLHIFCSAFSCESRQDWDHSHTVHYLSGIKFPIEPLLVSRQIKKDFEDLLVVVGVLLVVVLHHSFPTQKGNQSILASRLENWWFPKRVKRCEIWLPHDFHFCCEDCDFPERDFLPKGYYEKMKNLLSTPPVIPWDHYNCKLATCVSLRDRFRFFTVLPQIKASGFLNNILRTFSLTELIIFNNSFLPVEFPEEKWKELEELAKDARYGEIVARWDIKKEKKELLLWGEAEPDYFDKPFGFKRFYDGYVMPEDEGAEPEAPDDTPQTQP